VKEKKPSHVYQGSTELGLSRIITIYHAFILTFTATHSILASFTIDLITLSTFIAASLKYQVTLSIDRGIGSS
jgi:hypothetical protein